MGRALAERNYRLFKIGSIIALIGQWTQRIAIGWLAWELTRSGTWLGVIAFADLFPTVVGFERNRRQTIGAAGYHTFPHGSSHVMFTSI